MIQGKNPVRLVQKDFRTATPGGNCEETLNKLRNYHCQFFLESTTKTGQTLISLTNVYSFQF